MLRGEEVAEFIVCKTLLPSVLNKFVCSASASAL